MEQININNITKNYGKKQALSNINLSIKQGMFGLLGPNGAGKTTLMKILTTLISSNGGSFEICGISMKDKKEIRNIIGYLPQDFSMYGSMTVYEAMDYIGVLAGIDKKTRSIRIPELLEKVNLHNNKRTKVKAMSGGMRRRLGIAQAIMNDPKVLIVDEPTAGLDPEERVRFRNLLTELAQDRIVILSTHIVGDIEATCEAIAILNEGDIIYNGTVNQLIECTNGVIYTAEISKLELPKIKEKYVITSMVTQKDSVNVRFISDVKPFLTAEAVAPNVEDAYMYFMNQSRGNVSCL